MPTVSPETMEKGGFSGVFGMFRNREKSLKIARFYPRISDLPTIWPNDLAPIIWPKMLYYLRLRGGAAALEKGGFPSEKRATPRQNRGFSKEK
jgi:hypothetical protein